MQYKFSEWLSLRESVDISEAKVLRATDRPNPFLHAEQNEGDWVLFGVNMLFKKFKETGQVPKVADLQELLPYMGRIVYPDDPLKALKNNQVKVVMNSDSAIGKSYRGLKLGGKGEVMIKSSDLSDFTSLLGSGAVLSGDKVWLAAVNPTQRAKMAKMKTAEHQASQQAASMTPQTPDIGEDELAQARAALGIGQPTPQEDMTPTVQDIFGDDLDSGGTRQYDQEDQRVKQILQGRDPSQENPILQRMRNRSRVVRSDQPPLSPEELLQRNMRRRGTGGQPPQSGTGTYGMYAAAHDPSIMNYWKHHDDAKRYEYYPE